MGWLVLLRVRPQLAATKRNEVIRAHKDLSEIFVVEDGFTYQVDRMVTHILFTNCFRCSERHVYPSIACSTAPSSCSSASSDGVL